MLERNWKPQSNLRVVVVFRKDSPLKLTEMLTRKILVIIMNTYFILTGCQAVFSML